MTRVLFLHHVMVKPIAKLRAIEFDARHAPHLMCSFVNACTFFVIQTWIL